MTQLLKVDLKNILGDQCNQCPDPLLYVDQGCGGDPPTYRWRSLIERYVRNEVAFYVTTRKRPVEFTGKVAPVEYGVLLYWPGRHLQKIGLFDGLDDGAEVEMKRLHECASDMERAVLVAIGEFTKMPKGVLGVVPFAKRLFVLDQINGVLPDTSKLLVDSSLFEPVLLFEDRELVLRWERRGPSGCEDDKLPYQVIEGRSHIVNDFSDMDSPHGIWCAFDADKNGQYARLGIEMNLGNIGIGLKERAALGIENFYLLQCPREFQMDAV